MTSLIGVIKYLEDLFNDPKVKSFISDESAKISKAGLAPALALDAVGAFGSFNSIDSILTPVAAVGAMAGYYGGKNHWFDGPLLAGAYCLGARFAEPNTDLINYLGAYTLALAVGKGAQLVKKMFKGSKATK